MKINSKIIKCINSFLTENKQYSNNFFGFKFYLCNDFGFLLYQKTSYHRLNSDLNIISKENLFRIDYDGSSVKYLNKNQI